MQIQATNHFAKNGNPSAIMKELLSNLFKSACPILNTELGFKATGSRLCIWLWTLGNDSAYSSLFMNQTSLHSHAHVVVAQTDYIFNICIFHPAVPHWQNFQLWSLINLRQNPYSEDFLVLFCKEFSYFFLFKCSVNILKNY